MDDLARSDYAYKMKEEMLDGKIVFMSPSPRISHSLVVLNLARIFGDFLDGKPCTPFSDNVDVHLTEKDYVIPDLTIVCNPDIIQEGGIYGAPDLVVEVLSPGTSKKDKGYKKDLYERCGIKEYWLVEIESRSIEVYLLTDGKYVLDNVYSIYPDYELERMKEEEKAAIPYEFSPSIFPDMKVVLTDVFKRVK